MKRLATTTALAQVIGMMVAILAPSAAQAQYAPPYCPPAGAYAIPAPPVTGYVPPGAVPFAGSGYSFNTPGFTPSYYAPSYMAPAYFTRPTYDPGPYYYTPTYSYTPGYYSYYDSPRHYRY